MKHLDLMAAAQVLAERLGPDRIRSMPTAELVRIGADLWAVMDALQGVSQLLKDEVRSRSPKDPGNHILQGPGAMCSVTVQEPSLALRKDVPVPELREHLGPALFGELFEVTDTVTVRTRFPDMVLSLPDPARTIVSQSVDIVDRKPRVAFQRVP